MEGEGTGLRRVNSETADLARVRHACLPTLTLSKTHLFLLFHSNQQMKEKQVLHGVSPQRGEWSEMLEMIQSAIVGLELGNIETQFHTSRALTQRKSTWKEDSGVPGQKGQEVVELGR